MTSRSRAGVSLIVATLPEENGLWGILLPRPADKTERSAPDAQDVVQDITAGQSATEASTTYKSP